MAHWPVLQTASQSISDCGRDQPQVYPSDWGEVQGCPRGGCAGEDSQDGHSVRWTGEDGSYGNRGRIFRKRCGKAAHGDFKAPGAERFLRDVPGAL